MIRVDAILKITAKLATVEFLKLKVFWNKEYDALVSVHDFSNKNLSRKSNCFVDVNVKLYCRLYYRYTAIRYGPKVLPQCDKRVKQKSHRAAGTNSNICWLYRGTTGRGSLFANPLPPSWNPHCSQNPNESWKIKQKAVMETRDKINAQYLTNE